MFRQAYDHFLFARPAKKGCSYRTPKCTKLLVEMTSSMMHIFGFLQTNLSYSNTHSNFIFLPKFVWRMYYMLFSTPLVHDLFCTYLHIQIQSSLPSNFKQYSLNETNIKYFLVKSQSRMLHSSSPVNWQLDKFFVFVTHYWEAMSWVESWETDCFVKLSSVSYSRSVQ